MVKKTSTVPDAWEDDWETQADKATPEVEQPEPQVPLTKAERMAQHTELNRKLWESAETPQTFHYLEANNNIPFANTFKPQVKVLSRKPVLARRNPATGMGDDDDDDAPKKEVQLTPEEIRAKQKRDHEEKQRRYEEARAKIFGSNPSSGASSPGTVTPPRSDGHFSSRGRGRGRGGYRGNGERQSADVRQFDNSRQFESRPFENRRQPMSSTSGRELYDPNHSPKPEPQQKRGNDAASPARPWTPRDDQNTPIRTPRGPDGSGRGGFGFAQRGAKES